jgi:hypothetical protein
MLDMAFICSPVTPTLERKGQHIAIPLSYCTKGVPKLEECGTITDSCSENVNRETDSIARWDLEDIMSAHLEQNSRLQPRYRYKWESEQYSHRTGCSTGFFFLAAESLS